MPTSRPVDADYLVVGAGAMGMGFVDSLLTHRPSARVVVVDRRPGVGGHWRAAYPFVRLHQASGFYGVTSRLLGGGRLQTSGPEAGLSERADQPTICSYYDEVLASFGDAVTFLPETDRAEVSVPPSCRVVDARYLAPSIPAEEPPRFEVEAGARVVPVNQLPEVGDAGSYVVVGSGKTATDAIVWLLSRSVDPDAICWVRPREPWMLNRALIQPDPAIYLGMVATMMRASASADSLDALFLALEDAGIMLRIDRSLTPTMAKAPTLGVWELELLRSVEHVVRRGHLVSVAPGRLGFASGSVAVAPDAVVVTCASDGLKNAPLVPIWGPSAITLQPVRAGFPCFGAAVAGYVEATRSTDEEKNALCRPSSYGNSLEDWARMNVLGLRNSALLAAEPDVADWVARCALNPSRVAPDHAGSPELDAARAGLAEHVGPGVARLEELVARAG